MADVNKTIGILLEFKEIGKSKVIDTTATVLKTFGEKYGALYFKMADFGKMMGGSFSRGIGLAGNMLSGFWNIGKKVWETLRRMYFYLFRFRMEMLSVLFFGMAIQKFFMGLLQPALEASGIFELLSTILLVLFLPVVLSLLDPLLALAEWIFNLSDETKLWIGKFVIIGAIIGTVMMAVGGLVLGIMGLLTAFASIAIKAAIFWAILEVLEALGFNIKENLRDAFQSVIDTIDILWERLIDSAPVQKFLKTIGMTDEQIKKLKNPIDWLKEYLSNIWEDIKMKWNNKLLWLQIFLTLRFKQMLLELTGLNTWKELTDIWDKIKTAAELAIAGIVKAFEQLEKLHIPEAIAALFRGIEWSAQKYAEIKTRKQAENELLLSREGTAFNFSDLINGITDAIFSGFDKVISNLGLPTHPAGGGLTIPEKVGRM